MTREEAVEELRKGMPTFDSTDEECERYAEAYNMAIKALEQEPILDKIRAEIEQLPTNGRTNWDGCCPDIDYPVIEYVDVSKDKLLSIIDKYMAESEELKGENK